MAVEESPDVRALNAAIKLVDGSSEHLDNQPVEKIDQAIAQSNSYTGEADTRDTLTRIIDALDLEFPSEMAGLKAGLREGSGEVYDQTTVRDMLAQAIQAAAQIERQHPGKIEEVIAKEHPPAELFKT